MKQDSESFERSDSHRGEYLVAGTEPGWRAGEIGCQLQQNRMGEPNYSHFFLPI